MTLGFVTSRPLFLFLLCSAFSKRITILIKRFLITIKYWLNIQELSYREMNSHIQENCSSVFLNRRKLSISWCLLNHAGRKIQLSKRLVELELW